MINFNSNNTVFSLVVIQTVAQKIPTLTHQDYVLTHCSNFTQSYRVDLGASFKIKNFLVTTKCQSCGFENIKPLFVFLIPFPTLIASASPAQFTRLWASKTKYNKKKASTSIDFHYSYFIR